MAKFRMGATAFGFAATALLATSAYAIGNASECASEGGSWMQLSNSDYCLVQIRPEEYRDPVYDGNQLGVAECPGDTRHDGVYCMYPVNIRPKPAVATPADFETTPEEATTTIVNDVVDDAVESGVNAATDAVKDAVE